MFALLMGLETITPAALAARLGRRDTVIFDLNAAPSYEKHHVPGAALLDPAEDVALRLPTDKSATLVFYCSNPLCRKAPNAARRARKLGYANALVMSAGISGWLSANLPTEAGG